MFKLLEEKFLSGNYLGEKLDLIREFFQYFRNIWGLESHIANWFEGANPYNISHNQGIESKNGCIKKDYTFRDRLDTAIFLYKQIRYVEMTPAGMILFYLVPE